MTESGIRPLRGSLREKEEGISPERILLLKRLARLAEGSGAPGSLRASQEFLAALGDLPKTIIALIEFGEDLERERDDYFDRWMEAEEHARDD